MRKIFLFIAFISMYFLGQAQYAPTSSKTRFVNGIGLSTKDTASLSNAGDTLAMIVGKDSLVYFKYKGYWKPIAYNSSLNSYVKYSDTSSMLSPYQRSFSAMKYSDTATMLSSYYNKTATNSLLNTKLNTSDTATMLSGYKTYYPRNAISGGTGISYNPSTGVITNTSSGTVTSVATNNGSGITGGTITTSGTIAADTSILATRLRVQKGIDSVNANVSLKLNISDTANMLNGYKTYYPRNAISGGTGITYNAGTGVITNSSPSTGGTVTSVATDATMTGGTITTTGTLKVDTTVMATRLRVQKGIDSVNANVNLKVNISDTATMLSSYYNKTATDSKLALKLNISDTATMLSPYARTLALGGYIPYTGATSAIDLNSKTVVNISHLGINTTSVPTILLRAIGDNNSTSRISLRGYSSDANSSSMRVTKFRGTAASPQAPLSGDGLGKFELAGYGTTSSDGYPQASFEGIATENWGATARGAKVQVKVTPNTTITQAIALTINQDKSAVFENSITGTSFIKSGGTSSQFLKADGSVTTIIPSGSIDTGRAVTAIATGGSLNKVRDSLQANIGLKLNISDTATMLSSYYNKTATDSRLALKVNYTDTASMLSSYYNKTATNSLLNAKVNISDTSSMLSPYQRAYNAVKYTDTATMLSGYKTYYPRAALSAGTGITYNASTGVITNSSPSTGGTVTSVATNTGSGITGGTITSSGTIAADTSVLSTKANVTASLTSKVSSVSATSPIASSGGLTPTISISQSSGSTNGYLTSTDWNTFNNKGSGSVTSIATDATMTGGTITTSGTLKVDTSIMATRLRVQKGIDSLGAAKQGNITLTTTGTSGAATFSSNTLNIPQYQAAGTYVTSVTGTSPIVSSGGTTPAISIPAATTSVNGYLTSTDWNTFNNKQSALTNPVTGSGTTNYLPKFTGTSTIGNSAITDDGTTVSLLSRALSGTSATFSGAVSASQYFASSASTMYNATYSAASNGNALKINQQFAGGSGLNDFSLISVINKGANPYLTFNNGTNDIFTITNSGNVGIGTTSPFSQGSGATTMELAGNVYGQFFVSANSVSIRGVVMARASTLNDVYIASITNSPLLFGTNDSERMRITSGGNVLIGTTTDAGYKLDVNGTGRFSSSVTATSLSINTSGQARTFTTFYGSGSDGNNIFIGGGGLSSGTGGGASNLGSYNTANGVQALYSNTTGSYNTANGYQALQSNTTGNQNTANGVSALQFNTTGINNTANGVQALLYNTTGYYNTANGVSALQSNTTGYLNTANGVSALLFNTTGYQNTANGFNALYSNTTGNYNTANGVQALFSNTTGYSNTDNGVNALFSNTTGYQNTANGVNALFSNTTGYSNTANGVNAGYGTGTNSNTTGNNNIFIGNLSVGVSAIESNRTWIGNSSTTSTWLAGNVLIGTTTDAGYKLDVNGTGRFSGALTGTSASFGSTIFGNAPLNNTVITTSDATNITNGFNLLGSSSYWGIRTATSGNFNLDVYGAGSTKNALSIAQSTGAATFSSSVTAPQAYLSGTIPSGNVAFYMTSTIGTPQPIGMVLSPNYTTAGTSFLTDFIIQPTSDNGTRTTAQHQGLVINDIYKGTGHTITDNYGLIINNISAGTNNTALSVGMGLTQFLDKIELSSTIRLGGYSVAGLPTAGKLGRIAYVTDALTPTYGATVVGGGSVRTLVFDNGINWTVH